MFCPGEIWNDTAGAPIQAHGGGVLYAEGVYYWYGEHKGGPTLPGARVDVIGISCYSSRNLSDWKYEGLALPAVPDVPHHDLNPVNVAERPKVLYCEATRKYVMWFHCDSPGYSWASAGRAVSDSPTGPFLYIGRIRPGGFESRDMTLFKDTDGAAYVVFSSDMNRVMRIIRLTDDYLNTTDVQAEAFRAPAEHCGPEAPALLKHEGRYYFIGSECTGWAPNRARYATAPSVLGPWEERGDPCVGPDAELTFRAPSTYALPVEGRPNTFIMMFDRWNPKNLSDSRYVWLPVEFEGDRMTIRWRDSWDPSKMP